MKYKNALKIKSFVIALISLSICLYLWGQINGFEQGYTSGVFNEYPHVSEVKIAVHGPNFFDVMNQWYLIIISGFSLYIISNFLKPLAISSTLCILSLAVIIASSLQIISFKNEILDMEYKFPYDYWLNNSIYFDWSCLFTAITLMFIQVAIIIISKFDIEKIKID